MRTVSEDLKGLQSSFVMKEEFAVLKDQMRVAVRANEFEPIKKFVYGAVVLALCSLGAALISLVIRR
jgi:hypothetical protein